MKIYNTLSHKVEEFIPHSGNVVKMYTCGPTVYHYAHIGNLRTYIFEDILEKSLNYLGYDVKRVMNITDVGHLSSDADTGEDKMLMGAKREHKTVYEIADFYTKAFFSDTEKLNIKRPEVVSKASDNIDMYIKIIDNLLEKGIAYKSGNNVYFDTSKLNNYYVLTNHNEDSLLEGVRDDVEVDKNKRNKTDFVLWFTKSKFEDQQLKWNSPWGVGYPGWHIECSCISLNHLGEYLDIHCGGVDNIFPHHTNEIAQSEAFLGHKWCNYWFHNEHLIDETGKMSKSKGGILTVSKLEEQGFNPLSFRFMCLGSHYRKQLLFTNDNLVQAENTYKKLLKKISNINEEGKKDINHFDLYIEKFKCQLESDLNTSNALSILYELLKDNAVNGTTKISIIKEFDKVLALDLCANNTEISIELEDEINELINKRMLAKKNKDFEQADNIRNELLKKGIKLIDTREGTSYEIVKD